jgi:Predicted aminopeptidases
MRCKRSQLKFLVPLCLILASSLAGAGIDPDRYVEHVKYLASDELKGRGTGTPGLEKAAAYIAEQFRKAGLQPAGGKGYLQPFPVTTDARLGAKNRLVITEGSRSRQLKLNEDFVPFNFSASRTVSGQLVFAGYGITAPEYNYDDYAGIDVKDKIVILLRHEPQEFDENSVFAGKAYTQHAQFEAKGVNAKMHGARAVIFVNDQPTHRGDSDSLDKFVKHVGPASPGIPFVQVKVETVAGWLSKSGYDLRDIVESIDKDLKPRSFPLPDDLRVDLTVDVSRDVKTVHNVVGYLPGESDEYVILGAHYDHLGLGEQFSMAPSMAGTPHPGADDNASGTAGLIELAQWFAQQPKQRRGILFIAFAAEELGLLGSGYYVNNPRYPLEKAVAMINMDMIGRIREGKVYVGGAGTGTSFRQLLDEVRPRYNFTLDLSEQAGYGSSDHTSFTTKQIPILFFFSGLHSDYHRPSDTWDKIESKETSKLLELIAEVAAKLATDEQRPQFVRVAPSHHAAGGTGGGSGYGPYFGSVPDFAEVPNGFRFADVREGSPAAKAGLKAGDILFEFAGKPIENLYDFTYALRQTKPGQQVTVKVRRGSQVIETTVLLESRK